MRTLPSLAVAFMALALTACASITVTKVTPDNRKTVVGQIYSLPKPVIQVLPQADDTILVNVLWLPDADNTYAIHTSSWFSSYSYQATVNQNGTLAAVEFKKDTSVVGQQLAASAAAAATQVSNIKTANQLAVQTAVNTAQSSVDTAQAAYDKAVAQVLSDNKNGVTGTQLNTDEAAQAADLAVLQDAKAVLLRARSATQIGAYTAAAGTPITNTPPAPTTGQNSGFGPQTWSGSTEYELPQDRGGVFYVVNETLNGKGEPNLTLSAATLEGETQHGFQTANLASGVPTLQPPNQIIAQTTASLALQFSRPVTSIDDCKILTNADVDVTDNAKCDFTDKTPKSDHTSVTLTLPTNKKLAPQPYKLRVAFTYSPSPIMTKTSTEKAVSFAIQP